MHCIGICGRWPRPAVGRAGDFAPSLVLSALSLARLYKPYELHPQLCRYKVIRSTVVSIALKQQSAVHLRSSSGQHYSQLRSSYVS